MTILKTLMIVVMSMLAVLVMPTKAEAGEVCNETSFVLDIAKAWRTPAGLAVEGWTRIFPGQCADTDPGVEFEQYLYARSTPAYLGGVREWRGGEIACIDDPDFSFEGVSDCDALGLEAQRFRRLVGTERERTVLIEPARFGIRAEEAGLQRLLDAAGYYDRAIDGYAGRRTRQAVASFESDVGREFGNNRQALMEALHDYAFERNTDLGLTVCNNAGDTVAIALAQPVGNRWETRGWWRITSGTCARPVAARLDDQELYYFAQRTGPGVTELDALSLIEGSEEFCIAPARFLIEGRGDCANRTYETAMFRAVTDIENGSATIALDITDFEELLQ